MGQRETGYNEKGNRKSRKRGRGRRESSGRRKEQEGRQATERWLVRDAGDALDGGETDGG